MQEKMFTFINSIIEIENDRKNIMFSWLFKKNCVERGTRFTFCPAWKNGTGTFLNQKVASPHFPKEECPQRLYKIVHT